MHIPYKSTWGAAWGRPQQVRAARAVARPASSARIHADSLRALSASLPARSRSLASAGKAHLVSAAVVIPKPHCHMGARPTDWGVEPEEDKNV